MSNSGPTSATVGNIAIARAMERISFLPGNCRRAIAYAATVAIATDRNVAMSEIASEFRSADVNRSVWNTVR